MATKSKSRSRTKARSNSGTRSGSGVHVKPDMSNPRVARITVEIDWDELISRVVKKMGQTVRSRRTSRARRSRRTSAA